MRYFKLSEFNCSHTGRNEMKPEFLDKLDELRHRVGFAFIVTSGYRDKSHPKEVGKERGGTHTQGIAADIRVSNGASAYAIMKEAFNMGFTGIAYGKGFVHLDIRVTTPVSWIY